MLQIDKEDPYLLSNHKISFNIIPARPRSLQELHVDQFYGLVATMSTEFLLC